MFGYHVLGGGEWNALGHRVLWGVWHAPHSPTKDSFTHALPLPGPWRQVRLRSVSLKGDHSAVLSNWDSPGEVFRGQECHLTLPGQPHVWSLDLACWTGYRSIHLLCLWPCSGVPCGLQPEHWKPCSHGRGEPWGAAKDAPYLGMEFKTTAVQGRPVSIYGNIPMVRACGVHRHE